MKIRRFFSLYVLILFLLSVGHAHSNTQDITLVYTGNLDGELEPCGCSEGGNKGGLKRRAQALDELREENPALYLISTGGLITSDVVQDKLKSEYILKGMAQLGYDAIGIQWQDLSYGSVLLSNSQLPFVASNSRLVFSSQKLIRHGQSAINFFSWLDPARNPQKNVSDPMVKNNPASLSKNFAMAKLNKQLTILSTTLPLKLAQKKLMLDNVDILLIKSKYEHYGEPQQINEMLVLQPGSRGMRIGELKLTLKDGRIIDWQHRVIPLPSDVADAPRMDKWYAAYNAEVKVDYEKSVEIRKKREKGESPFAGESVCKNCHIQEHNKWRNTRHADAFYTLQDTNKAFDPNCIQCHTVGFNVQGGFIEPTMTENLMHVQCENCHGAAKAHAKSAGIKPVSNKDWKKEKMCEQCHTQKHSSEFDYEAYWKKISHGKMP